jgi:hypothetical protein
MKNLIIIFLISVSILSCDKTKRSDLKKIKLIDFTQKKIDTLIPYKSKTYYSYYVKVKGEINDSVKIKRKDHYDIILIGNIDTLINGDYYGNEKIIWVFDPFKATKGELEIEYGL